MTTIDITTAALFYPSDRGRRHVLEAAIADGWTVNSRASEDDARYGLTASEADDIADEDPALIYLTRETLESPLALARLASIASDLGAVVVDVAAEGGRDVWAKVDDLAADFSGSVRAWQVEGGTAGDHEVCAWADAVLALDDLAPVRDAYLGAAAAAATRIAGPRPTDPPATPTCPRCDHDHFLHLRLLSGDAEIVRREVQCSRCSFTGVLVDPRRGRRVRRPDRRVGVIFFCRRLIDRRRPTTDISPPSGGPVAPGLRRNTTAPMRRTENHHVQDQAQHYPPLRHPRRRRPLG